MMFKKVLVPVDGSPHMPKLVQQAVELAKSTESTLTFLHVVNLPKTTPAAEIERQKVACRKIPDQCKERATSEGISSSSRVEMGSPAETIIDVADRDKFDLIMIGSKGHSRLKTILVGSVADQVMEHALCPVLLLK